MKIFDFKTRFLPLYFQHLQSHSKSGTQKGVVLDPFPDPDVMLSFGQRWDDRRPIENTLIWAKVRSAFSQKLFTNLIFAFFHLNSPAHLFDSSSVPRITKVQF